MGIFGGNYSKPGPGVPKNAPKKKGLALFYEILFRKFWKLITLNLLYILILLPTFAVIFFLSGMISNKIGINLDTLNRLVGDSVQAARLSITSDLLIRLMVSLFFTILWGGGPATAGFVYILRSFVREEPVFLASDFFDALKSNFKQALIVWITDTLVFSLICYAYFFYGSMTNLLYYVKYILLVLAFFYTILHQFIYHLLITYKLSIIQLYKNSALFALSSLPWCTLSVAVISFLILICPAIGFTSQVGGLSAFFTLMTFAVIIFILFSLCGFITEFNASAQIKKYIKEDTNVEEKSKHKEN